MRLVDEAARINERIWDQHAARGDHNSSRPKQIAEPEALRDYAEGRRKNLPAQYRDEFPENVMMRESTGKDVLCLASGGGHQSAEFGLLGANVTVLDISIRQLSLDGKAAKHYDYDVTTVHGDMRDLSAFEAESYDLVVQGVGICFVPNIIEVYREVARVLRPGSLYSVVHTNPFTYPVEFDGPRNGWDGTGYRIAEEYCRGPIRRTQDGCEGMKDGEITGEFRHSFSDIFNGLVDCGFELVRVGADRPGADIQATPGTPAHMSAVVPQYFTTIARKALPFHI